uniref:Thymidylate kinase n=1 Tax=Desulfatirhabdium butyrativorans TaxID=340467 RepID=A0A7C4RPS6_9BACT
MFITFEGIEGSGKSTQVKLLAEWLTQRGVPCVTTREPGATPIGARIRTLLLDPASRDLVADAELLLYLADRVQHLKTLILPALEAGNIVISDRYADATLVYQGYARGIDPDRILDLHRRLCGGFDPDRTFLLDLPVAEGLFRAQRALDDGERSKRESRFEQEAIEFHENVRSGYLTVARMHPKRFTIVDATRSPEEMQTIVRNEVDRLLNHPNRSAP